MNKERKSALIETYKSHGEDTGSVNVQIALMTERINELNEHFKAHPHDYASKTGLMKLVGQRRRYLRYLKSKSEKSYKELIDRLGIRG
jgi:small subunit ribosomal protein S15